MTPSRRSDPVAVGWKGLSSIALWEAAVTRDSRGYVRVPYRGVNGETVKAKMFAPNGRTYWAPVGVEQIPLGLEVIAAPGRREGRTLVICEGESCTLATRQALAEDHDAYPVDVIGLPGAGTWRPDWAQYLVGYSRAYVIGDGDEAGRRMMDAVLRSVAWVRPVRLPEGEDARDFLQRDGDRALDPYLDEADRVALLAAAMRVAPTLAEFHDVLGRLA